MKNHIIAILFTALTIINAQDKPTVKISGQIFGDYFYNISKNKLQPSGNIYLTGAKDSSAFQIRRVNLTTDFDVSSKFTARFRLEVDQTATKSPDKTTSYVKDAYLKWKEIFSGSDIIMGIQPTPTYEVADLVWGHRYIEKNLADIYKLVSSRDLGVALKGKIISDGSLSYTLLVGSNTGVSPESDSYRRYYSQILYKPIDKLFLNISADWIPAPKSGTKTKNKFLADIFAGYVDKDLFSAGVEFNFNNEQNGFTTLTNTESKQAIGISAFGSYYITSDFGLFARYDIFNPNISDNNAAKGDGRTILFAGLDYKADKTVTISPNIIMETYEKSVAGVEYKSSLTGRITFNVLFWEIIFIYKQEKEEYN